MDKFTKWGQEGKARLASIPDAQKSLNGRKGGIKTQRKQKARRTAKEVMIDLLMSDSTDKDIASVVMGKDIEPTEQATLLYNMMKKASKSANMAELVFRLTGDLQEQPQQNITIVNQLTDEQLQRQIADLRGQGGMIDVTPEPPKLEE
jgi:hypothetical protein